MLQVLSLLGPADLLHLSRVSKRIRKILLHPSARGMWAASRKNMNGLPVIPDGLSEPYYASLLFDQHCMVCTSGHVSTSSQPGSTIFRDVVLQMPRRLTMRCLSGSVRRVGQ